MCGQNLQRRRHLHLLVWSGAAAGTIDTQWRYCIYNVCRSLSRRWLAFKCADGFLGTRRRWRHSIDWTLNDSIFNNFSLLLLLLLLLHHAIRNVSMSVSVVLCSDSLFLFQRLFFLFFHFFFPFFVKKKDRFNRQPLLAWHGYISPTSSAPLPHMKHFSYPA